MVSSVQSLRFLKFQFCFVYFFTLNAVLASQISVSYYGYRLDARRTPAPNNGYHCNYFNCEVSHQCNRQLRISRLTDPLTYGDEPFWDEQSRSLLFADTLGSTVYKYDVDMRRLYYGRLVDTYNSTVSAIIPIKGAAGKYLSTYEDKLAIITWDETRTNVSYEIIRQPDPYHLWPDYFVTDVKVVPNGAVFFYSKPVPSTTTGLASLPRSQSSLFSILNGEQKTLLSNLDFGNGIGYDCDGDLIYHSDSIQRITYKSWYNPRANSIITTQVLLNYTEKAIPGTPDSLTVDREGFIWIALNGGNGIIKVDPDNGNVVCFLALPIEAVTNLAFGGCPYERNGNLNCLYVTTSSQGVRSPSTYGYDGAVLVIHGTGSEGVLPYSVEWNEIANSNYGGNRALYSYPSGYSYDNSAEYNNVK